MSDTAIRVEGVGKLYNLGHVGIGTLSQDLSRWWAKVRGREDPFAKVGQVNDRAGEKQSDFVWALKDISFDVKQGEILGIIGRNGAGKSTLLKLLSKVTRPTEGSIKVRGRVASLLEVGTGFHPELTGRENVFLNGAILGMQKDEIRRKFDEIVDFAGVQLYIDTPVKRYSSGMYVRLAFAVAAYLEPEILIIDEVLAVGDAEFQRKCLARVKEVSARDGRTVLFVSHDMSAIAALAQRCVLLSEGTLETIGPTRDTIAAYVSVRNGEFSAPPREHPSITRVRVETSEPDMVQGHGKPLKVSIEIHMPEGREGMATSFQIINQFNAAVTVNWVFDIEQPLCRTAGFHELSFQFEALRLYQGQYSLLVHLAETNNTRTKFSTINCSDFTVDMLDVPPPDKEWQPGACVYMESGKWVHEGRTIKTLGRLVGDSASAAARVGSV